MSSGVTNYPVFRLCGHCDSVRWGGRALGEDLLLLGMQLTMLEGGGGRVSAVHPDNHQD